ncbi:hypothetical protein A5733_11475 [Mycobacterium sp. NS-7484]|uniref:hypothetical protein n=1 Tax=Mycobacterium sp. NS-7484 TaxID=1834161 RepID=UPI00096DDE76|nr:hypothetical protein [Mycobacterium sp. NS-7484]OMB96485.1 hypothetical protein A5733_11475 [Mycobacterium sp. NS-7484]
MNAAEHIECAKSLVARGGRADYATAHALIAIAEQGQPVEHAIDVAELRQQRPIVLTDDELNRAAESLVEHTGMSLLACGNIVARIIRDINEFESEVTG